MLIKTFAYPLDFTGAAITNKIVAERQTISPGNGAAFNFFIPKAGPFFGDSLVVRHVASGVELTPGVDFTPSYFFLNASNTANSLRIYGSVTILDTSYAGTFEIDYQTLGGEFTYDEQTLLHILAVTQLDPRITNWDAIINHPSLFPPENHLHHVGTSMGYDDLVAAVNNLVQTFTLESGNLMQYVQQHIDDKNNPHLTNLLKLGIQRFESVYIASAAKMRAGTDNLDYATALGVKAATDQLHDQIAAEHYALANPHGTTKSNVNLGQVENWRPATQTDATNVSATTYVNPAIVAYMIGQAIQGLPIAQITSIEQSLQQHIQNLNNPHQTTTAQLGIGLANFALGAAGQLPFYNGTSAPLDFTASMVLNNLAIVTNAAKLTTQLAARETFADAFNSWQRIAFALGNPNAYPNELTGWSYNAGTDRITTNTNSTSTIGLLSPDPVSGDYVFEVLLTSTNSDDDEIGICLGMEPIGNGYGALFLMRTATAPASGGGSGRLTLKYVAATGNATYISVTGLPSFANGWAGYGALGPVRLKAERVGTVLTVSTSEPGSATYNTVRTLDLATIPALAPFMGAVNLGYVAQSQTASSWETIQRTGAQPTIAATHTAQVYEWNGTDYSLSAKAINTVILPGRYYRNSLTKEVYFSSSAGSAFLISGQAGFKDFTQASAVNDRLVYVDVSGISYTGTKTVFTYQNPTTGVTTVRGGIDAQVDKLGFTKASGDYYAYFSVADGKMYHYGLQYLSDPSVKQITHELVPVFNTTAVSDLILQTWTWLDDARVPVEMHGQVDFGLLTTDVAKYCPRVITKNPDGLETYDQSKLSLVLSIHAHERLSKLDRLAELTPAQLDKLISMLEE